MGGFGGFFFSSLAHIMGICKILTENVKYTSLMVFLFTRDTWHYSPFWSSSIPQCNLLLSLEVNSSITNVNILFNLTSSQTNIFVASAQVTLSVTHWKAADCDSCCTRMYWMAWWLCPKPPRACWEQGTPRIGILQTREEEYFSFPTGKYCVPPDRHRYQKYNQLTTVNPPQEPN